MRATWAAGGAWSIRRAAALAGRSGPELLARTIGARPRSRHTPLAIWLLAVSLVAAVLAPLPVTLAAATEVEPKGDIVFVVDESGSMAEDIADVKARIGDVVDQLDDAGVDARIGVVGFSAGNRIYAPLTDDLAAITAGVGMLTANRDNPEAGFSATVAAMGDAMGFRSDAAACQVLITDEDADITPAFPETQAQALAALRSRNAGFYAVVPPNGSQQFQYGPQPGSLAAETRGATFYLADFRADAGAIIEDLIDACVMRIENSQPFRLDAGPDQASVEGSLVALDGFASTSTRVVESRGRFNVSAKSNIFAAGLGAPTGAGGILPTEVPGMVPGSEVTFSGASGLTYGTTTCTGTAYPPDGAGGNTAIGPTGGISGVIQPGRQPLVGVFIGDTAPAAPAPVRLDFTGARTEFSSLRPTIGQTFFIGDGLSPAGVRHVFEVPPGATRLFLGLAWSSYNPLCGSFGIDVHAGAQIPPISYEWEVVSSSGPPVALSSTFDPSTTFRAIDDGVYRLRLTASDGFETKSDDVVVTVTNTAPTLEASVTPSAARGLAMVSGSFTDPGFVDTHRVRIDWADGSPVEEFVPPDDGGSLGSFIAPHQYAAGTYSPVVTLLDDDGGAATATRSVTVAKAVALWANATTGDNNLQIVGTGQIVDGLTHSNTDLDVVGVDHQLLGGTEYRTTYDLVGTATVAPAAVHMPVAKPLPVTYDLGAYRPGGARAAAAGAQYFNLTSSCASNLVTLRVNDIVNGLYYSPCPVVVVGQDIQRDITVVSEDTVVAAASGVGLAPFIDGLLVASSSTSEAAVKLAGSNTVFAGTTYAPSGRAIIAGTNTKVRCGVFAQRITVGTTGLLSSPVRIDAGGCRPNQDAMFLPGVVSPKIASSLTVDEATALPGETLHYTATITNTGSTLAVPALVGIENPGPQTVGVSGASFVVETRAPGGVWSPLASTGTGDLTVVSRPAPASGVSYGTAIAGTNIQANKTAAWATLSVTELDPADIERLHDPARVNAVRVRIDFTTTPANQVVVPLVRYGPDLAPGLRAQPTDVDDASLVLALPAGGPARYDSENDTDLESVEAGDTVSIDLDRTLRVIPSRGESEPSDTYRARLEDANGATMLAAVSAEASTPRGLVVAPTDTAQTTQHVPVLSLDVDNPDQVHPAQSANWTITTHNDGSTGRVRRGRHARADQPRAPARHRTGQRDRPRRVELRQRDLRHPLGPARRPRHRHQPHLDR